MAKTIILTSDNAEFRTVETLSAYFPHHAEDIYHVTIDAHYDTLKCVLTPIHNGETPTGWDTIDDQLASAKECVSGWFALGYDQ